MERADLRLLAISTSRLCCISGAATGFGSPHTAILSLFNVIVTSVVLTAASDLLLYVFGPFVVPGSLPLARKAEFFLCLHITFYRLNSVNTNILPRLFIFIPHFFTYTYRLTPVMRISHFFTFLSVYSVLR